MKVLIYFDPKSKLDNFEGTRIRRSLKSALEYQDESYFSSPLSSGYEVVHFIDLTEINKFKKEYGKNFKFVLSLLSTEADLTIPSLFKAATNKLEEGNFVAKRKQLEIINSVDLVFAPSELAKKYLIEKGVTARIEVLPIPLRITRFDISLNPLKTAIFSHFQFPEETKLIVSVIDYRDEAAFEKIKKLAEKFPKYKFICISHTTNRNHLSIRFRNNLKKIPRNLLFIEPLTNDLYSSLLYNASIFVSCNSNYGNDIEVYEAMVSKTQILALKGSIFEDIAIDKENSYVYNSFDALIDGIDSFFNERMELTIEKAAQFCKKASYKSIGVDLIKFYKELEGE